MIVGAMVDLPAPFGPPMTMTVGECDATGQGC